MVEGGNAPAAALTAAAATEVRVVRCPKCEKLLPELVGFKVYRCGGCNAALQANKSTATVEMATSLEKSEDKKMAFSNIPETPSSKKGVPSNACQETDLSESPSSVTDSNEFRKISVEEDTLKQNCPRDGGYRRPSKAPVISHCSNADEIFKADAEENMRKKMQMESGHDGHKARQNHAHKGHEGEGKSGFRRTLLRASSLGTQFSPYPDEGPSNYQQSSDNRNHDVDHHVKYRNPGLPHRVELLEQDRAELLRKLDELRDQLSRSCEVTDKKYDKVPMEKSTVSTHPYELHGLSGSCHEGPSSLNQPSVRHFPLVNGHDSNFQHYNPALHNQNELLGYGEPFGPQLSGRIPFHPSQQYPQRPSNGYLYEHFDPVISYHHDAFYRQPVYSHPNFCNKNWQMPSQISSTVFGNRRGPYPANHGFYPVDGPAVLNAGSYNQRSTTSFLSRYPENYQRPVFKKQNGRRCHPLAGGAPFVVCYNCFQLLQVPPKLLLRDKHQNKLRCGACSQLITFEVNGNRLVVAAPVRKMDSTSEAQHDTSDGLEEDLQNMVCKKAAPIGSDSGDYDNSTYNIHSADEKFILSSPPDVPVVNNEMMEKEYSVNSSESENMEGLSSASSAPKDGRSIDAIIYQRSMTRSAELPPKSDVYSRAPGVPLREHFGYSSFNHAGSRSETGSRSTRSEQEKVVPINGNFKQNSVKDVLMASEMDLPVDQYPNPVLSQDSKDTCKDDIPRMSKAGDSFFAGLIKKSFKDFSRSHQPAENGKVKVLVNGHPIPDRLVKKAEKQAGPVQPGEYWYDYRAGFWGVMGQPCIGIIPPFIEEFNYPMPKNCSGGNTGVLVNGRELNQKDLDLLAGRGLPTSRDNSYIIEISGRVLDAETGEELDCLGKLAPTVEKVKHGFGMRIPRVPAA